MNAAAPKSLRMRATVVKGNGERIKINAIAASRNQLEAVLDSAYPDARMVSIIVERGAKHG